MEINWPELLIGVVVGTLCGWALTHAYYLRGKRDAEAQTAERRRFFVTLALAAERQGLVTLARDARGEITGGELVTGQLNATLGDATLRAVGRLPARRAE